MNILLFVITSFMLIACSSEIELEQNYNKNKIYRKNSSYNLLFDDNRISDWENAGCNSIVLNEENIDTVIYDKDDNMNFNSIQKLLLQAIKLKTGQSKFVVKIKLKQTEYNLTQPLFFDSKHSNIIIEGENTILSFSYNSEKPNTKYKKLGSCIKVSSVDNFGIKKITINSKPLVKTLPLFEKLMTNNVFFKNSSNCFIDSIKSHFAIKRHIASINSRNISITNSIFENAYSYGTIKGAGYGVSLSFNTQYCLIENNYFNHLRHAMMLEFSAHHNVFAYNYSKEQYSTNRIVIRNYLGDIEVHGGKNTSYNLFEGNIVTRIQIDMYHGTNGSYNTFLRNKCFDKIIIETERWDNPNKSIDDDNYGIGNNFHNLIGNDAKVEFIKFEKGIIKSKKVKSKQPKDVLLITGTENDLLLPIISLYRKSKPNFITKEYSWPPIGQPVSLSKKVKQKLPAKKLYKN